MKKPSYILVCSALILVQILFGLNFVASKIIVGQMSPSFWAAIRFWSAAALLLPIVLIRNRYFPKPSLKYLATIFLFAMLGFTVGQLVFLKGLKMTTAVNSSIICSTIPLFTLLIVVLRKQEKLTWNKGIGFLIAFLGVLFIRKFEDFSFSNETFLGDVLVLINSISTAIYISCSRNFLKENNHWWASTWMFLIGGFQIFFFAQFDPNQTMPTTYSPLLIGAMLFSILGATLLTYFLINWSLVHIASGKVSLFIFLQPVVASLIAWIYLDEHITSRTIISCVLILIGFALAMKTSSKEQKS